MHPTREKMNQALKAIAVPKLRAAGFTGSFPHLRRVHAEHAELVVFQFNKYGGSFVIEIAKFTAEEVKAHWRTDVSLNNATVYEAAERHRLGGSITADKWLVFGKRTDEPNHDLVEPESHYVAISERVAALLTSEAERWWASDNHSFTRSPDGAA